MEADGTVLDRVGYADHMPVLGLQFRVLFYAGVIDEECIFA